MCESSSKLTGWLDRELAPDETAAMERHVAACRECQEMARLFQEASRAFAIHANGVYVHTNAPVRRRPPVLLLASGLAAALVALLLLMPGRAPELPLRIQVSTPGAPADALLSSRFSAVAVAQSPHAFTRTTTAASAWMPPQPIFQIAIPSEALFPPGVVPEGFAFLADVSLAADGSPSQLALRP
jgi:hypothetical protein